MTILYLDCFLGFDAGMVLGSLLDLGLKDKDIENALKEAGIKALITSEPAVRSGIECKKVKITSLDVNCAHLCLKDERFKKISPQLSSLKDEDIIAIKAVLCALELLGADLTICSAITLPSGTSGEVISVLDDMGVPQLPGDDSSPEISLKDVLFLKVILTESGPKPQMDIIATGYGAGGEREDIPHLICGVLGKFEDEIFSVATEDAELITKI